MFDMRLKNMIDAIEAHLIARHGIGFIALSQEKKYAMIVHTFHELMQMQRERQD